MSKDGVVKIHGKEYKTVALRVSEFREGHSIEDGWAIRCELVNQDEQTVTAAADIVAPDGTIVARDYAEESRTASRINQTSALENCMTSAIGRALAAAGFAGSEYASADEVANAISNQGKPQPVTKKQGEFLYELVLSSNLDHDGFATKVQKMFAAKEVKRGDYKSVIRQLTKDEASRLIETIKEENERSNDGLDDSDIPL